MHLILWCHIYEQTILLSKVIDRFYFNHEEKEIILWKILRWHFKFYAMSVFLVFNYFPVSLFCLYKTVSWKGFLWEVFLACQSVHVNWSIRPIGKGNKFLVKNGFSFVFVFWWPNLISYKLKLLHIGKNSKLMFGKFHWLVDNWIIALSIAPKSLTPTCLEKIRPVPAEDQGDVKGWDTAGQGRREKEKFPSKIFLPTFPLSVFAIKIIKPQ